MYYVLCVSGVSKLVSNNLTLVRYLNIKNVSLHLLKRKKKQKKQKTKKNQAIHIT